MCRGRSSSSATSSSGSNTGFRLVSIIGAGKYAKVMLVRDTHSRTVHALKTVARSRVDSAAATAAASEQRILQKAKHKFIVNLHWAFQTANQMCLVLEFCAGGELFFHLNQAGSFTLARCQFHMAEITIALEHLHSLDILYRDLKPENVLLEANGHIKLADFGSSKILPPGKTTTKTWCGTLEFMAPEIMNGRSYSKSVDWYAAGALTCALLTGAPPFYSRNRDVMMNKARAGSWVCPPTITHAPAAMFISSLLCKNPGERLGSQGGAAQVKTHEFWSGVDWHAVEQCDITPPFIPDVASSSDTKYFSSEFLDLELDDADQLLYASTLSDSEGLEGESLLETKSAERDSKQFGSQALKYLSLICYGKPEHRPSFV